MRNDGPDKNVISRRTAILGAGGLGVFGVLAARLYYLQVVRAEDYRSLSEDNRFNFNITIPSRGRIIDRNGESLAINKQEYRVVIIPERVKDLKETLRRVSDVVDISDSSMQRIEQDVRKNAGFVPILVKDRMDWAEFSEINLKTPELPGVIPEGGEGRAYPDGGIFTHILGYVGRAGPKDVENDKDPLLLQPTFRIGKTGVEAAADKKLRGEAGRLKVEVNAVGRIVREWPDPKDSARHGQDVWLTIDAELQRYAASQFGEESGGIAVIDIITGELRTLLSMPTFDGNLFVSGLTQDDMKRLNSDPKRPQFNKVIGGRYPPASTFKMVVMLAALESGLINPQQPVFCVGKLRMGNRTFHCWKRHGHGRVNMREALKQSCDSYFYEISQVIGIDKIAEMGRRLGLGQKYDLGIGGSNAGIMPTENWKSVKIGTGWRTGDTLNASIGQGFVEATPLQLAVMTSRIANSQKAVIPHLIIDDAVPEMTALDVNPRHLEFVKDAMFSVCEEAGGTAYRPDSLGIPDVKLAGKTGTGQVRGISASERRTGVLRNSKLEWKYRDHSIFVGFAPYKTPRFAIGCIVEHGGSGAGHAARITRAVMKKALERDGLGEEAVLESDGASL